MSKNAKDIIFKPVPFDISIKQLQYHESNGLNEHYLVLKFTGADFHVKLLNTLRRICTNYIPVYAYAREAISIKENTSDAFNNDMMSLDLSLMPVIGVDPQLYELDEKYWYGVNYLDPERLKHPSEKNIEFHLNKHNNSLDYVRVTTNEARTTIDGDEIKMYNEKYPLLLIELAANQTFKCHMKGVLGIAENPKSGALWKSAMNAYYDETSPGEFKFTVYGNDMFSEKELLIRSCKFAVSKMSKLKQFIIDKVNSKELVAAKKMEFVFDNEDHTTGEPINYELQNHKDIVYSGLKKPDLLIKSVIIKAECSKNIESPIQPLLDAIETVRDKFHKIGHLLENLNNKKTESENEKEPPKKAKSQKKEESESESETSEIKKKSKKGKGKSKK